jgi:hypothetical protein
LAALTGIGFIAGRLTRALSASTLAWSMRSSRWRLRMQAPAFCLLWGDFCAADEIAAAPVPSMKLGVCLAIPHLFVEALLFKYKILFARI